MANKNYDREEPDDFMEAIRRERDGENLSQAEKDSIEDEVDRRTSKHGLTDSEYEDGVANYRDGAKGFSEGPNTSKESSRDPNFFENTAGDEKKALEDAGYLVRKSRNTGKRSAVRQSRLKKGMQKKAVVILGGLGVSAGGALLGFFFSILPFELQHVKNVFETEIGGVRDSVLVGRRGRLYSRSFFFHQESPDRIAQFDGYRSRGLVAGITGRNLRSEHLLVEMRRKGFVVEMEPGRNGRFTGRLRSINGNGVNITDGGAFQQTWRSRAAGRSEIRKFFDTEFDHRSAFWRARKARVVYARYRLGALRGNWLQEASVRQANNIRMKVRQALYGELRDQPDARIRNTVPTDELDDDGRPINTDTGGEFADQAAERRRSFLGSDRIFRRANAADVARTAGRTTFRGARALSLFGAVQNLCDLKRILNVLVVGSRLLRAEALTAYATLMLSVADVTLTGEVDSQDVGALTEVLRRENPLTGRSFFGSGSWQWASTGSGTVDGDIRSEYSIGGGFTGTLASANSNIDRNLPAGSTCNLVNNVFIQIAGGLAAGVAAFFTFGASAATSVAIGVATAIALAVVEAIVVPMIIDMIAGTIIHGDEWGDEVAGALVSGYVAYNGVQSNNHAMKPVTNAQYAVLVKQRDAEIAAAQADMGVFERYFSPQNHRSITSVASISMPRSLKSGITTVSSFISNPFSMFASPLGAVTANKTYVAAQGSSQCNDRDITENDLATDPFCNLLYAQDVNTLAVDPVENIAWMIDNDYMDEDGTPTNSERGQEYQDYIDRCINIFDPIHTNEDEDNSEFTTRCYLSRLAAEPDGTLREMSEEEFIARQEKVYDFDDLYVAYMVQDGDFEEYKARVADGTEGKVYAQSDEEDGVELANLTPTIVQRFSAARMDEVLLDSAAEDFNADYENRASEVVSQGGGNSGGSVSLLEGDAAELAQELLDRVDEGGNIRFGATSSCNTGCVRGVFEQTARGELADVTASNASVTEVAVSPNILRAILAVSDAGHQQQITSLTTGGHGDGSNHYRGTAVDLSTFYTEVDDVFRFLHDNAQELGINELIFDPPPTGTTTLRGGSPHTYSPGVRSNHAGHIHFSTQD